MINKQPEAKIVSEEYEKKIALQKQLVSAGKSAKISQSELAKQAGMSQQQISRIETGNGWNIVSLMRYAAGLGYEIRISKIRS